MKVVWSAHALGQLAAVHAYVAQDSPRYAKRPVDRLTSRSRMLARFPAGGAVVPEYPHDEVRQLIEGAYRLIYRVRAGEAVVVSVLHAAQELPRALPE